MQSLDTQLGALKTLINRLDESIQTATTDDIDTAKYQKHLDNLDMRTQQAAYPLTPKQYAHMLELQALIHLADGKDDEASSCLKEAYANKPFEPISDSAVQFLQRSTNQVLAQIPDYFTVSTARFIVLGILTLSIYGIYWAYKNWKAVETHLNAGNTGKKKRVHPILSSIFFPLTSHELFVRVRESTQQLGIDARVPAGATAWTVFFTNIIGLSFIPLTIFQKHINRVKIAAYGDARIRRGTSIGEVIFVVLGIAYALSIGNSYADNSATLSTDAQTQLTASQTLLEQYNTCSADLESRRSSVDTTNQAAVDSFNADLQACENIRIQQNAAVDEYNRLVQ